jgi:hypothetical protein
MTQNISPVIAQVHKREQHQQQSSIKIDAFVDRRRPSLVEAWKGRELEETINHSE